MQLSAAEKAKQSASNAEASKRAAAQSEQNINNTVTAFDDHVEEKKSEAGTAINKVRDAAVKAVTDQQSTSVQAVKDQTASYIAEKETSAKTEIGNYISEKIAEINKKASEQTQHWQIRSQTELLSKHSWKQPFPQQPKPKPPLMLPTRQQAKPKPPLTQQHQKLKPN